MVLVADGIYTGGGNKNLDYAGKSVIVVSENGPEATVIDCQNDGRGFYFHSGECSDSRLESFTITNGYTTSGGGGVLCEQSSPTITRCIIIANTADMDGGGIKCNESSAHITACAIQENVSGQDGGGINFWNSSMIIHNCIVSGNAAARDGAGIACWNSSAEIFNCTVSGNTASIRGGGIMCDESSPVVTNCILWDDSPDEIHVTLGDPVVTYSDVQGGWTGEGNIQRAPLFVAFEDYDFHLRNWSPCIDRGIEIEALKYDFEGNLRYDHSYLPDDPSIWDMGANEFNDLSIVHVPGEFATIQAGIDVATDDEIVLVADGTYNGEGNKDLDFEGKSIVVMSENGPTATVIDCQYDGRGFYFHSGEGSMSKLIGFSVRNAYSDSCGGAIRCSGSSPCITNCILSGNTTAGDGGGIFCSEGSAPDIANCILNFNMALYDGGGLYCDMSSPTLTNFIFNGNSADIHGGAVKCNSSSLVFINCTIVENTASAGGGLGCYQSTPFITNCILWNDSPNEICYEAGDPVVTYTCIQGGWADEGNIDADPLFTDVMNGDFHLIPASPCIDAGNNSNAPEADLDDQFRPFPRDGDYDMGAYERWPLLDITLELVPDSVERGESFAMNYNIANPEPWNLFARGWIDVYLPGGEPYSGNPIEGPVPFRIGAGKLRMGALNETMPHQAYVGMYIFCLETAEEYEGISFGSASDTLTVVP